MKLLWALQRGCNLKCDYCYFKIQKRKSIFFKSYDINKIHKKISAFGIRQIIISGGEPLISPNLHKFSAFFSSKGIDVILTTNGTLLSKSSIQSILESNTKGVIVSLDSYRSDYHNKVRGGFEETINGIYELVKIKEANNLRIGVCCVITKQNLSDIFTTLKYSIDLGVDYFKFQPVYIPNNNKKLKHYNLESKDYIQLRDSLELLYLIGKDIVMPVRNKMEWVLNALIENRHTVEDCWVGKRLFFLSEKNVFYPCPTLSIVDPSSGINLDEEMKSCSLEKKVCKNFSTDCACLWEVAYQNCFV